MTELLTAAQMRAIEQAAISSGNVTGLELMERAGRGVVEAIFEEWPELRAAEDGGAAPKPPRYLDQDDVKPFRAVVLCGPGNNGGDGFVVARLLTERGWALEVFFYGDAARLPPDARVNYERWAELGPIRGWDDNAIEDWLDENALSLVVDALFGTGLTRPMPGDTERTWHGFVPRIFNEASETRQKYVAIDIPSGLCSDSGKNFDGALPSDLTVTFHRSKVGHHLSPLGPPAGGAGWCGKIVVKDIGLPNEDTAGSVRLTAMGFVARSWLPKFNHKHKFSHGHALVLSGGITSGGAARLAARGALRIGAGVVTLGCPPSAVMTNAAHLNAIMLKPIVDAVALADVLEDTRINALCLGPGMGTGAAQAELLAMALDQSRGEPRPTVLDADALTLLAGDAALFGLLHKNCVLTPHAGEFARLFPDIAAKLAEPATKGPAYSKVDACREAAKRAGCVVLFKGPDTVIAAPDGHCSINAASYDRAAPWLATAGAGDVLAGFITGLLARGFTPMRAAESAAWLHVECARSFGPGLIAEDLPEELPKVFRALGLA